MVLATIIRLEMAYPGVGILAGDSLQYLTVVTAHAVIMVFFMIMPLLSELLQISSYQPNSESMMSPSLD